MDVTMVTGPAVLTKGTKRKADDIEHLYVCQHSPFVPYAHGEGNGNPLRDAICRKYISSNQSDGNGETEYASSDERRGVAANRWLQGQVAFCKYLQQNQFIIPDCGPWVKPHDAGADCITTAHDKSECVGDHMT